MSGVTSTQTTIRLDAAVAEALTQPVSDENRAEFERLQAIFALHTEPADPFDPPSLSNAMFNFIMPQLRNVTILRLERRRKLLASVIRRLQRDAAKNTFAHGGAMALRYELRILDLLRGNRDSLISG